MKAGVVILVGSEGRRSLRRHKEARSVGTSFVPYTRLRAVTISKPPGIARPFCVEHFPWTHRSNSLSVMMRNKASSSMQKTYDECYLICSTAVYFEGQVSALQAYRMIREIVKLTQDSVIEQRCRSTSFMALSPRSDLLSQCL